MRASLRSPKDTGDYIRLAAAAGPKPSIQPKKLAVWGVPDGQDRD